MSLATALRKSGFSATADISRSARLTRNSAATHKILLRRYRAVALDYKQSIITKSTAKRKYPQVIQSARYVCAGWFPVHPGRR